MTMIPGVTVQKNGEGRITHITIDVEQQKELAQPVLDRIEVKSKFREDFEKGLTLEQAREDMLQHLKNLYAGNLLLSI